MESVAFNFLPYTSKGHGGAEVYLVNTAITFAKLNPSIKVYIFINNQQSDRFSDKIYNCFIKVPIFSFGLSRISRILSEQLLLPLRCQQIKVDWLISNYISPIWGKTRKIVIVHDMLIKRYPSLIENKKLLYWNAAMPVSLKSAHLVGTVSKFSASEIKYFFPNVEQKLFVTPEGIRPVLVNSIKNDLPFELKGVSQYILCVATFGAHKNLISLIEAFNLIINAFPQLKLVFVGSAKTPDALQYQKKVKSCIKRLELTDEIIFLGHIRDSEFASIYSNAILTVMPSLYEGFGLPIIESQHFDTPAACSNCASMPEVAGNAAVLFNPYDHKDIANKISGVLQAENSLQTLTENCKKNIEKYTWENTAAAIKTAMESYDAKNL